MDKYINNDLLFLGIIFLTIGLSVGSYSYSTYKEIKNLDTKIDFEMIDHNSELSPLDKYYKYISIADFLNQKLTKNQNIPIKNTSCVYLDYAQHNAIELYNLTERKLGMDEAKKFIAAENVRKLSNTLSNYKTCKKSAEYKNELNEILEKIEKRQNLYSEKQPMDDYLNSYNSRRLDNIPQETDSTAEVQLQAQPEEYSTQPQPLAPIENEQQTYPNNETY